jgi:hypothetical protein
MGRVIIFAVLFMIAGCSEKIVSRSITVPFDIAFIPTALIPGVPLFPITRQVIAEEDFSKLSANWQEVKSTGDPEKIIAFVASIGELKEELNCDTCYPSPNKAESPIYTEIMDASGLKHHYDAAKKTNSRAGYLSLIGYAKSNTFYKLMQDYVKPPAKHSAEAFNIAKTANSQSSYEEFLKWYPNGPLSDQARAAIDDFVFAAAKDANRLADYDGYLSQYKNGKHTFEASTLREEAAYRNSTRKDSLETYQEYLADYPYGNYFAEVQKLVSIKLAEQAEDKRIGDLRAVIIDTLSVSRIAEETEGKRAREYKIKAMSGVISTSNLYRYASLLLDCKERLASNWKVYKRLGGKADSINELTAKNKQSYGLKMYFIPY